MYNITLRPFRALFSNAIITVFPFSDFLFRDASIGTTAALLAQVQNVRPSEKVHGFCPQIEITKVSIGTCCSLLNASIQEMHNNGFARCQYDVRWTCILMGACGVVFSVR